jgi:ankyrin repeat protein
MNAPQSFFNACSTGKQAIVAEHLANGVHPEARDTNHLTGLIWAGRKGHVAVADVLLKAGAKVNVGDLRSRTSLFHAVTYKRYEYVLYFISRGADPNIVDTHGWSALDFAVSNQDQKMVGLLKDLGAKSARDAA